MALHSVWLADAESELATAACGPAPLTAPAALPLHVPPLSQPAAPSRWIALSSGPVCCVTLTMGELADLRPKKTSRGFSQREPCLRTLRMGHHVRSPFLFHQLEWPVSAKTGLGTTRRKRR